MKKLIKIIFLSFFMLLFSNVFSANSRIKIFGSAIENKSFELLTNDGNVYVIKNQPIIPGGIMFIQNDMFFWGGGFFPKGTSFSNSYDSISIPVGGKYDITFILSSGKFDFKLVGDPDPSDIQIFGNVIKFDAEDVLMKTDDNINYYLKNQPLESGYLSFKLIAKNIMFWGGSVFPSGTARIGSSDLIYIEKGAYYDISFNRFTGSYNLIKVKEFPEIISISGSAVDNDLNTVELNTEDGVIYTLKNKLLTTGNLSFRKQNDFFFDFLGGKTFPKGVINSETSEIDVRTGGVYNITFNKQTLSYNFELIGEPLKSIITLDQYGPEYSKIELNTYDGVLYTSENIVIKKGNYVFTQDHHWQWASRQFPEGIAEFKSNTDIDINVAGVYNISFDLKTGAYNFQLIGKPFYDSIRLFGSSLSGHTNNEVEFSTLDGITYTLKNQILKEGNLEFLYDEYYFYESWSAKDFPKGIAKSFGQNIDVYIGGNYDIIFNKKTLEYEFKLLGNPSVSNIEIINYDGKSTFTTQLSSKDGIIYTIYNQPFYKGQVSMQQNYSEHWSWSWGIIGYPKGNASFETYDSINIENSGRYNFSFNKITKEYSFELIELANPRVGIIGGAINNWSEDIAMNTEDGVVYTLNKQLLSKGELRFRQDNNFEFNWGNKEYPNGIGKLFGEGIPISKEGYYDIMFNLQTKEYSFKELTLNVMDYEEVIKFNVFPNPITDDILFLSEEANISLFDLTGRLIFQKSKVNSIDVSSLSKGHYILKNDKGYSVKVILR